MAGNWKMNLNHLEAIAVAQKLVYSLEDKDYDAVDIAVIPPFTDIRSIQTLVDGDRLRLLYGAQDVSPEASGAFTGDISGSMLAKLGCTFVVIGHSERRAIHNEDDALINRKIKAALTNELTPIFCVGEELSIREAGTHVSHVVRQIRAGLEGFHKPDLKKILTLGLLSKFGVVAIERDAKAKVFSWPVGLSEAKVRSYGAGAIHYGLLSEPNRSENG